MNSGGYRRGWAFIVLLLSLSPVAFAQAESRVELELVAEEGFPMQFAHQWMAELKNLGFSNLRVRSAKPSDRVEVRQRGSEDSPSYQVTGLLTTKKTLILPEGEFRLGDTAGISKWLGKLREGGERRLQETESAFGLTPTQLVSVHKALSVPVTFSTKGQRAFDVLKQIASGLSLSFLTDPAAREVMTGEHAVVDELQGLTAGTVMVAVLRPLGLVLVPQKQADATIKLWITDVRSARESWPVGWPSEKPPREAAPQLFNFLNVEIQDQKLAGTLEIVGKRLEMPLLFDHNSLARQRIDPAQLAVSLPAERMYYLRIIDRLLNQAQLKSELRVDEAGTPFLWISTLKR
jgi:hypothetical protein